MIAQLDLVVGKTNMISRWVPTAEEVVAKLDLNGKHYLITGAASGLGLETARVLGKRGAQVTVTARSPVQAASIVAGPLQGRGRGFALDLSEPTSVDRAIHDIQKNCPPIDGLICNAGVMAPPTLQQKHGLELQFLVNHLGHFRLVRGLLSRLSTAGRVVMVSSRAHRRAPRDGIQFDNLSGERQYFGYRAYGQSKLANILFCKMLAQQLGAGQTTYALHPGVIPTKLNRHLPSAIKVVKKLISPVFLKSVGQGAATQVYLATDPEVPGPSGGYFADLHPVTCSRLAQDEALAQRLWEVSEQLDSRLG